MLTFVITVLKSYLNNLEDEILLFFKYAVFNFNGYLALILYY
jgi:hypothetical protein